MKKTLFLSLLVSIVGSGWLLPESSQAADRGCKGTLGSITVDNLSVASGHTCKLNGTNVKGNLFVGANATLVAAEIKLSGNLQASRAAQVSVTFFSVIDGNIEIQRSRSVNISASRIDGNLALVANTGAVSARGNQVKGNLEVFQNSGGVLIRNNRIEGNLICKGNRTAPTGNDNAVQGNKENQCSRL
jgi:hypothetical protein